MASPPLNIKVPETATQFQEELPLKCRAVAIRQKQRVFIQTNLLDNEGKPVDLEDYGIEPTVSQAGGAASGSSQSSSLSSTSSSASSASSAGTTFGQVDAVFYESAFRERTLWRVQAEVLDSKTGLVKVFVPAQVRDAPGVYLADIGVLNAAGDLLFDNTLYIYVERSGWGDLKGPIGPQLLKNIRASMAEADPLQSLLREEYVYDLSDICYAATRAVQFWNDSPPPVSTAMFSTRSFPFPEIWLTGIQLYLLEAAEEWYRRNKLAYNAGGTQVDDLARDREYKVAWQERFAEWRRKVMHKKAELNANNGYRSLGSGYTIGQVSAIRHSTGVY